jgi:hypothetical protein
MFGRRGLMAREVPSKNLRRPNPPNPESDRRENPSTATFTGAIPFSMFHYRNWSQILTEILNSNNNGLGKIIGETILAAIDSEHAIRVCHE